MTQLASILNVVYLISEKIAGYQAITSVFISTEMLALYSKPEGKQNR